MHQRTLGKTGFQVSEIGFGAWAIGADWGEVPESQAREALHAALEAGMNVIDTADIYGAGRSERIIGSVLRERPRGEPIHVLTKMGRGDGWIDEFDAIRRAALGSIERLGVEALDLVQLHCIPTETLRAGRALDHLEALRSEGLIRHYGVSVETIDEGLFCIDHGGPSTLQVIYNLFRQRVTDELLPAAREADVGIIARVPLASGLLTGKFTAHSKFPADDHRHYNADGEAFNVGETFAGVPMPAGVEFAGEIARLLEGEAPGASLAQKSLRWILDHEAVGTVIPGAKTPGQARANAAASDVAPLSAEAHRALERLYRERIHPTVRGVY